MYICSQLWAWQLFQIITIRWQERGHHYLWAQQASVEAISEADPTVSSFVVFYQAFDFRCTRDFVSWSMFFIANISIPEVS